LRITFGDASLVFKAKAKRIFPRLFDDIRIKIKQLNHNRRKQANKYHNLIQGTLKLTCFDIITKIVDNPISVFDVYASTDDAKVQTPTLQ
jgi:hypothetical protein